jgi:hypothetical protein
MHPKLAIPRLGLIALVCLLAIQAQGFVDLPGLVHTNVVQARVDWPGKLQVATLVNQTNFAEARWEPLRGPVTVHLGEGDGLKTVSFFLADTNGAVWRIMRETKLDTTPFRFVLEKPASTIVTVTPLDWVGYFTRYASMPRCRLRDSEGRQSEVEIYVVNQADRDDALIFSGSESHHNLLTISAADMPLTLGTNVVTLSALDDHDRAFQTNLTFVLDYQRLTNAPHIHLLHPQPGAEISGPTFTIRGYTDTPGASVRAEIQSDGGAVEVHQALVETSGIFWLEELPLGRSNAVRIVAHNERGLERWTNFTVFKASYNLRMDPVPEARLWDPFVTVTGTLDATNHAVWVNGVRAQLGADGKWSAQKVPTVPGNTAVFEVVAVPLSENGGLRASAARLPAMPPAELLLPRNVTARMRRAPNPSEMMASLHRRREFGPTLVRQPTNTPALAISVTKAGARPAPDLMEMVDSNEALLRRISLAGGGLLLAVGVWAWLRKVRQNRP